MSVPLKSQAPISQQQQQQQQQQGHHHHHHHHHGHMGISNESKLYTMSTIELKDPLEITLEEAFNKLINSPSASSNPENLFNDLSNYANQSKAHYDEVCNALLYSILTDAPNSARFLRYLFLCNNVSIGNSAMGDSNNASSQSYATLINNLMNIITENYNRLLDSVRQQLLWLLRELVKARVNQFDKLVLQMLRNIQTGSLSDKNIWLAESMLDILYEQTSNGNNSTSTGLDQGGQQSLWIYAHNELLSQSVYTYIRLIADHAQNGSLSQLRQRETEFCVQVLRERWNECMLIGRDLVRLLQNVSKIGEFEQLWKDIIHSPQTLSPLFAQYGGLLYLMKLPTKRRCLICRLTVDMERKIYFIITSVKAGQQKRYLDWFQKQFLSTPESQSLRVDIIRYICAVVHPTNEQLNAGLTPRWAVCAWLLNTCSSPFDCANIKLALFYDWLVYDAKKDNIMLIEPAILLLFNSMRIQTGSSNINVTLANMLFDFLCRVATNYFPSLKEQLVNGISQSFKDCVEKRVIPSLLLFFQVDPGKSMPVIDREIRNLFQTTFGTHFQSMNLFASNKSDGFMPINQQAPQALSIQPVQQAQSGAQLPSPSILTPLASPVGSPLPMSSPKLIKEEQVDLKTMMSEEPSSLFESNEVNKIISSSENLSAQVAVSSGSSSGTSSTSTSSSRNSEDYVENGKEDEKQSKCTSDTLELVQEQLEQYLSKPFKVFSSTVTCVDESTLDTHLNLIHSDELREKLFDLNDKLKQASSSSLTFATVNKFKEILSFICNDVEFLSDFHSALTELAAVLCLILKNEFTNHLLPSRVTDQAVFLHQCTNHQLKQQSKSSSQLGDMNESIAQRLIFVLFKELAQTANQSNERETLMHLLNEIYLKQSRIGYYFVYYLYSMYATVSSSALDESTEYATLCRVYHDFINERHRQQQEASKHHSSAGFRSSSSSATHSSADEYFSSSTLNESSEDEEAKKGKEAHSDNSSDSENEDNRHSNEEDDDDDDDEDNNDAKRKKLRRQGESKSSNELTDTDCKVGMHMMHDLRLCQQDDAYLFTFLLPYLFAEKNQLLNRFYFVNNSEFAYLLVSSIDPRQLRELNVAITSQELSLFKQTSFASSKQDKTTNGKQKATSQTNKKRKRKEKQGANAKHTGKSFKKESLYDVLSASLNWESVEQMFFWELLDSHVETGSIKLDFLIPWWIASKLDVNKSAEAVNALFKMLRASEPTNNLLKYLLQFKSNRGQNEPFSSSLNTSGSLSNDELLSQDDLLLRALFVNWTRTYGTTKMTQLFIKQLNKSAQTSATKSQTVVKKIKIDDTLSSFSNSKRLTAEQQLELNNNKRSNSNHHHHNQSSLNSANLQELVNSNTQPSLEQCLVLLNRLRLNNVCINFILKQNFLNMLKKIYKKHVDEEMKQRFADLFTLVDEFNEERNANKANADEENNSGEESESQSEEEYTKKTQKGKTGTKKPVSSNQTSAGRKLATSNASTAGNKRKNVQQKGKSANSSKNAHSSDNSMSSVTNSSQSGTSDSSDSSSASEDESKTGKRQKKRSLKAAGSSTKSGSKKVSSKSPFSSSKANAQQPPRKKPKHNQDSDDQSD